MFHSEIHHILEVVLKWVSCKKIQYNSNNYYQNMFNLHEGTAAGSNHVEHREGVDDETELLVGQKGVQQNEAYSYDEWFSCSSIQQAEWNK